MSKKTGVGFIGCGDVAKLYFPVAQTFKNLDIVACADIDLQLARSQAEKHGLKLACSVDDLLAREDIEIVVNLTPPAAHAKVAIAALQAGKSVYNEKPLTIQREEARYILALAMTKGLEVGGAPDTFMGAGLQTCRKLIDEGAIGEPVGAAAFMMGHGPEAWHPNPDFFYQPGAGPLFDVGPYYLTALVALLGPVSRVSGAGRISFPERIVGSGPKKGEKIRVGTPTHIAGLLEFAGGPLGTITTSFDVWNSQTPYIEIYGSEGTLSTPDPNTFGGPVRLWSTKSEAWEEQPLVAGYTENSRSLGVADMADAMQRGREPRASGEMAYHVLDIMLAIQEAAESGSRVELLSECERPEAFWEGRLG